MQMDVWYDLLVRELTDGIDPTRELLKDAEAVQAAADATAPDDDAVRPEDRGDGAPCGAPSSSPARTCTRVDACRAASGGTSSRV